MNIYKVKLELEADIEAFSESDAKEYLNDMFGPDHEVKTMKITYLEETNG